MTALRELRSQIDRLDDAILDLLNQRARVVLRIRDLKRGRGAFVPHRERQVLDRLAARNRGPFPTQSLLAVFREIMSASLALEGRPCIAWPRSRGRTGYRAARAKFGASCGYLAAGSVEEVFSKVESGGADFGVVPVEDARRGLNKSTLERFGRSPLRVCGELALDGSRFWVIGRTEAEPSGRDKTSLLVRLRPKPGTLAALIRPLRRARANLSAVESLVAPGLNGLKGERTLFLEFEGHLRRGGASNLLKHLRRYALELRVLGSYPVP